MTDVRPAPETRCGSIAILGAPNAGKSTLMNAIIGSKVSIVSRKVQTTRCRVTGIFSETSTQIIFVDTPGLFEARKPLERAMVDEVWRALYDVDVLLLLIDAVTVKNPPDFVQLDKILARKRGDQPLLLALNKIDEVTPRARLLDMAAAFNDHYAFAHTLMISAKTTNGVRDLVGAITTHLPLGPHLYPEDQVTDIPLALLSSEVTREQIFDRLHEELPYQIMVETTAFEQDDAKKDITIHQNIIVARDNHKGMVIGKKGQTLKQLGASARHALEDIFERRVHLFLHVIVDERWQEKAERLRSGGLMLR